MAFSNSNAASQLFGGINAGARQAAGGWKQLHNQQQTANASAGQFVKTMFAAGGVIAALREIVKLSSSRKNLGDFLLGDPAKVRAHFSGIFAAIAKLDADSSALRKKLDAKFGNNYLITGKRRKELVEKLKSKREEAHELHDSLPTREDLPSVTEGVAHGLLAVLKKPSVDATLVIGQQVLTRWYSFNEAVKATNVSFENRQALYKIAVDNELRLGRSIGDTAAVLDVARKNGMLYGKTINSGLAETVKLSLQAEDALGLQPHDLDEIIASSNKMAQPYHDVLNAITDINQQLGLSGEEAAKLYAQVSDIAFSFGLSGKGVTDVTTEVSKMTLALRSVGITDNQAALRIVSKLAESGTSQSFMFGGGPEILENKGALSHSLNREAGYLRNFAPRAGLTGAALNQANIVFKQMSESIGLTTTEGFELIKMVDAMNASFGKIVTNSPDVVDVAAKQLEDSGKIWKRLGAQIVNAFTQWTVEMSPYIDKLSHGLTAIHDWFRDLSDDSKKWIETVGLVVAGVTSLVGVLTALKTAFGVVSVFKNLTAIAEMAGGGAAASSAATGFGALLQVFKSPLAVSLTAASIVAIYEAWKEGSKDVPDIINSNQVATTALAGISPNKMTKEELDDLESARHMSNIYGTIAAPTVHLDKIAGSQRALIDRIFGSSDLTYAAGDKFLRAQDNSLGNSQLTGQQQAGVRKVYSDEIHSLTAKAISDLGTANSDESRKELLREIKVLQALLQDLTMINRDHMRQDSRQWGEDNRNSDNQLRKNEDLSFITRSVTGQRAAADLVGTSFNIS